MGLFVFSKLRRIFWINFHISLKSPEDLDVNVSPYYILGNLSPFLFSDYAHFAKYKRPYSHEENEKEFYTFSII